MKINRYWSKCTDTAKNKAGDEWELVGWGGSNISLDDAKQAAANKISQMLWLLASRGTLDRYEYIIDSELREQVTATFGDSESPYAAITRNRYGALVLNAERVFFADVDIPIDKLDKRWGRPFSDSFFSRWFNRGRRQKRLEQREAEKADILDRFERFHRDNKRLNLRLYETAAGYRAIVTNVDAAPDSRLSRDWFEALGTDPLYRTLCRKQHCFRARLTPKPWRLNLYLKARFKPDSDIDGKKLKKWLKNYDEASKVVSVCNLVKVYGSEEMTVQAQTVVDVHDRFVLNNTAERLA